MTILTGSKAIMEIFRKEGVQYIFGLPGSTEFEFLDTLEDYPDLQYILGLHESIVVGMAEGYSRASGKVGVCSLHTSSGLASAMSGLLNAYGAKAQLLLIAGQQDTRLMMSEPALTADLKTMASSFTKWGAEIIHTNDIPLTLRRAFKLAAEEPTGPVFISLPQDVLTQNLDFEYPTSSDSSPSLYPDPDAVTRAADILMKAKSPVMLVGSGIARHHAVSEVVSLAEKIGARVYHTWMSDVNFPTNHSLYLGDLKLMGPDIRKKLQSSDVLVSIGNPVFRMVNYIPESLLASETKVVHIDEENWEIGKNIPVAAGVAGNIKVSVGKINSILTENMSSQAQQAALNRLRTISDEKMELTEALHQKALTEKDNTPISVSWLMHEIGRSLKPGTILVDDSWSSSTPLRNYIELTEPGSYHRIREYRHGGGSIGWGMPVAMGVKLAYPNRPVVAVVGDGSAIFYCQSLWTAAHYNIPLVFVVLANSSYHALKWAKVLKMGDQKRGRFLGMDFSEPRINFCQLAQSMGVQGQRIENPDNINEALSSAIKVEKPALIEVIIEDAV